MGGDGLVPGSARLHLIDGLPLLRPNEQVFEAMIKGWRTSSSPEIPRWGTSMTRNARSGPSPGMPMRCRGSGRRSTSTNGRPICGPCTAASAPPCATTKAPCGSSVRYGKAKKGSPPKPSCLSRYAFVARLACDNGPRVKGAERPSHPNAGAKLPGSAPYFHQRHCRSARSEAAARERMGTSWERKDHARCSKTG